MSAKQKVLRIRRETGPIVSNSRRTVLVSYSQELNLNIIQVEFCRSVTVFEDLHAVNVDRTEMFVLPNDTLNMALAIADWCRMTDDRNDRNEETKDEAQAAIG